jgi:hypothetical protein
MITIIGSMWRDSRALSALFSRRLEKADPRRKHAIWKAFKYPGGQEVVERQRAAERPRQESGKNKDYAERSVPRV